MRAIRVVKSVTTHVIARPALVLAVAVAVAVALRAIRVVKRK